jgi:hypothetical protein
MQASLSTSQRHRLGLLFILGSALLACHLLWLPQVTVDDAYISYRYARNLVNDHGLVFNPGERVEGFSNPLWVLLTAAGMLCRLEPVGWTRGLGMASLFGSLIAAVYLARRVTGSQWAALGVAVILAASTALCGSAVGGLETGLYAMLVTWAIVCVATERFGWASALMGLAAITRPEGAGICVIGISVIWLMRKGVERRRAVIRLMVPCGVILAALLVFRLSYYGDWLANSVRAKSALLPLLRDSELSRWPGVLFNDAGIGYVLDFVRYGFGGAILLAIVPALPGGKGRWIAALMLSSLGMGVAVAVYNFGDWMSCFRLLTPYLPITTVLVVWGMVDLLRRLREQLHESWCGPCRLALAGLVMYMAAGQFQWRRPMIGKNPDRELACLLNQSRQPGLLAATDVLGRLSYFADKVPVLDMAGLTDVYIAEHGKPSPPFGRTDFDYVLSRRPHFIMNNVRSAWARRLKTPAFVDEYWWVDRAAWTQPGDEAADAPRFVFVRRGSVLGSELQRRYPAAAFRPPQEIVSEGSSCLPGNSCLPPTLYVFSG